MQPFLMYSHTFGSQILGPKVCDYIKSGHTLGRCSVVNCRFYVLLPGLEVLVRSRIKRLTSNKRSPERDEIASETQVMYVMSNVEFSDISELTSTWNKVEP
jgi:hypothetical protein